jgi:cell division septum initiation protein DivIVA
MLAYDRPSVERFFNAYASERTRLQRAIDEARARSERARQDAARSADSTADLTELVLAAQRDLDEIECKHRDTIQTVERAAAAEAKRIVDAAHAEAAQIRAAALSLVARATHDHL